MSLSHPRPAFAFSANILGQLEAAGTPYFEGCIAMPGNRAHIKSMPGFRPAVIATAIDVESPYVEVVLGERCDLDATVQLRTRDNAVIDVHLFGDLMITTEAVTTALQGGRSIISSARFTFRTGDWRYMALALQDRTFLGEGVLFWGEDGHLYVRYAVNEVSGGN
ncbi:hypothetical protein N7536_010412 [Penicillium majusculum]|uniref:Uncharacterized protein n=1 Tax=Penicillium solitum TaxID=60172 RepID=A0A1V6RDD8_9EURO|nr:uncharacterized protein PENSOL_c006G09766 [Penicillium solitum]KAJ5687793.1 hypothetical protein N7536_010412 [Penicillium majusculum]OQD99555.1 hypothetical protein PENSOL_c006G09766 [Penicillium solitum]